MKRCFRLHATGRIFLLLMQLAILVVGVSAFSGVASAKTVPVLASYLQHVHPKATYLGKAGQQFACQDPVRPFRCYAPSQITRAYNIDPLYKIGVKGKGQTIVIVDFSQDPTIVQDVHSFDQLFGLPDTKINVIAPFGTDPADPGTNTETTLDVEWAHAIAPEATIDLVLAKQRPTDQTYSDLYEDLLRSVKYGVDQHLGNVVSLSYGFPEPCLSASAKNYSHAILKEAADKKISVFVSAGDAGATGFADATNGCGPAGYPYFPSRVTLFPASDPYATAVGGTYLDTDMAAKYKSETAWTQVSTNPDNGATGGGYVQTYAKPAYQNGIAAIGSRRGIPDIAYNGDPRSGVLLLCSSCGVGANAIFSVGGTSAGAPQWAGITALGDQLAHHALGFLNPALYRIGKSELARYTYHDIVVGNNTYRFLDANKKLVTVLGYDTLKGWDPVTGWGTPIVSRLLPALIVATDKDK